jgi:transcriptional regulator with XRE-family HTH domain
VHEGMSAGSASVCSLTRVTARTGAPRTSARTVNGRRTRKVVRAVMADFDRLRLDSGISLRRLGVAAEVDPGYLTQIFAGTRLPSVAVLVAVGGALGADLSIRAYPTTGPVIHDRGQARIVEELLRIAAPVWHGIPEVAVQRPARGFIDVVFDSQSLATIVATEVESRIDRLEQQLRWAQDKAASLPSAAMWPYLVGDRSTSRLLVLRSTAANRELARRFEATLRAAYPARAAEVFASLTTGSPWPGPGILWADVRGDVARILDRPPRGVLVGR